jgi:hypothetical protein
MKHLSKCRYISAKVLYIASYCYNRRKYKGGKKLLLVRYLIYYSAVGENNLSYSVGRWQV